MGIHIYEIINAEQSSNSILDNIDTIVNILSSLVVIVGGILGTLLLTSLREKNLNATFGYFARLKVRINFLLNTFTNNKVEILNRLFNPDGERREDDPQKTAFIDKVIQNFAKEAEETRYFLKHEDDQMPCSKEWIDNYSTFLGFLEDCENLQYPMYFKNTETSEQNEYFSKHTENMKKMLELIDKRQNYLGNKFFKSSFKEKISKKFNKRRSSTVSSENTI